MGLKAVIDIILFLYASAKAGSLASVQEYFITTYAHDLWPLLPQGKIQKQVIARLASALH